MKPNTLFLKVSLLSFLVLTIIFLIAGCELPASSSMNSGFNSGGTNNFSNNRSLIHFKDSEEAVIRPNSMVYFNGQYHLFYGKLGVGKAYPQYGHAVSRNMINWESKKSIILADSLDQIMTMGVVSGGKEDKKLEAICKLGKASSPYFEKVISTDSGETWQPQGKITGLKTDKGPLQDPTVFWHEPTQKWVMVAAVQNEVQIYNSTDLIDWKYESSFGGNQGYYDGKTPWEKPNILQLNVDDKPSRSKWVLIVSIKNGHPTDGYGTQYFVGNFDGKKFRNSNDSKKVLWLDWGSDNFGGITWSGAQKGRQLFIGTIPNIRNVNVLTESENINSLTTPRELKLKDTYYGFKLFATPITELKKLHKSKISQQSIRLSDQENAITSPIKVPTIIACEFTQNSNEGFTIELSNKRDEKMEIGYDGIRKMYFTQVGKNEVVEVKGKQQAGRHISPRFSTLPKMNVKIIVDACSVECYIDDGLTVLTEYVVPTTNFDQMKLWGTTGKMMLNIDLLKITSKLQL